MIMIRHVRHRLRATSDGDGSFAQLHHLRRRNDRLHTRPAEPVQGQRRHLQRHPRLQSDGARQHAVARAGRHHLADDDMLHVCRRDGSAGQRLLHHDAAKLRGHERLQGAAKIADRRPGAADNIDIFHHLVLCTIGCQCCTCTRSCAPTHRCQGQCAYRWTDKRSAHAWPQHRAIWPKRRRPFRVDP